MSNANATLPLTTGEVARRLGVSQQYVRARLDAVLCPTVDPRNGRRFYDASTVEAYCAKRDHERTQRGQR